MKKKKHLGQNFLINNNITKKIANLITPTENDLIIEVGSGDGALTKHLKKFNATIISYEIDVDLKPKLEKLKDDKTIFIYKDFLKTNIKDDIDISKYDRIYFIGNLPYYITTPIITKLSEENIDFEQIVVLVQKEVAERFSAVTNTKNYSYFTVYLNYLYYVTYEFGVNKRHFSPAPRVNSAVISLIPHNRYEYDEDFIKFIKSAFIHKRKKLTNNIKNKQKLREILKDLNIDLNVRGENLSIEDFINIYEKYSQ